MKGQSTIEVVLFAGLMIGLVIIVIGFLLGYLNTSSLTTLSVPLTMSNLNFYNFVETSNGACSLEISFVTNQLFNMSKVDFGFMLSNGDYFYPSYKNYTTSTSVLPDGDYLYNLVANNGFYGYNASLCSFMASASNNKNNYVVGITRILNNKNRVVSKFLNQLQFLVNTPDTNPTNLFNKNVVGTGATHNIGVILVTGNNNNTTTDFTATIGEYLYLTTGTYNIEYLSEGSGAIFLQWVGTGGASVQNQEAQVTNVTVTNNGELFVDNYLSLAPPQQFNIVENQTNTLTGKEVNVKAIYGTGYYTFYVNNTPYASCIDISSTSCDITQTVAGTYTITATYKNSTNYAVSNPLQEVFYKSPSLSLTGSYNSGVLQLTADHSGGYGTVYYYFYFQNGSAVPTCQDITNPVCDFSHAFPSPQIPITIKNPTGATFIGNNGGQIELTSLTPSLSQISTPISNDRFFEGSTELYSWCEANCGTNNPVVWVNIPSGISAGQTVTITLTGAGSQTFEFYAKAIDSVGTVNANTSVPVVSQTSYNTWTGHMGNKTYNNDIGSVMNSGLLYNSYNGDNSSYTGSNNGCNTFVTTPQLLNGSLLQDSSVSGLQQKNSLPCVSISQLPPTRTLQPNSSYSSYYDSYTGTYKGSKYAIFNTGSGCFYGIGCNELYTWWGMKAIGWIEVPTKTNFSFTSMYELSFANTTFDNIPNSLSHWIGNQFTFNRYALGNGTTISGTQRVEFTYSNTYLTDENEETVLFVATSSQVYYYSPTVNESKLIVTYG